MPTEDKYHPPTGPDPDCKNCKGEGRTYIQHPLKPRGVTMMSLPCPECNSEDHSFGRLDG